MKKTVGITLAALGAGVMAQPLFAQELVFTISNNADAALVELYASPRSAGSWGADIMGGQQLASGEAAEVAIGDSAGQCDYDLRMVFSDGSTLEDASNLCDAPTVTVE
jgi:ethanolamine utilization microcompartment shell protein EutL